MKKFFSLFAALLLFLGFGMIHAGTTMVESMGSVFIGVGAFYFIVKLVLSQRRSSGKNLNA